ncbi:MAG: glycoside hydrolase family 3 protein [Oscillospiraceae bacterium]|nr:glycoside hydrolase family 3 protein [Oscillospiraceae bacterium]
MIACASRYMDAADENGVAVSIKHFPGDGVDERDQHILTSVNSLSCEEWDASYGRVYKTLIDKGAKTVMVGHIAQPAWAKKIKPEASKEEMLLPASLNSALMTGLLRDTRGFNGVISTDATPMVGFGAAMPRSRSVPTAIAAGADIILFNKDLDEDYGYLLAGIESGILSEERLNEAVTRILALKASLHLPEKQAAGTLVPPPEALAAVGSEQFRAWADEVADKAITLVQDRKKLLPLSPAKHPRLYLNVIQKDADPNNEFTQMWKTLFENEGFEVTVRDRRVSITVQDFMTESLSPEKGKLMHEMYRSVEEMKQDYDLYVYVANMQNASNNTTLRLNWNVAFGLGDDAPWMTAEIPVLMISTGYPYHLFDAPMIGTYINAYSNAPHFCKAVVEKLMGRSEFVGVAPSDPYCGKEWLKW